MRENGPCVIASFAQLASVRGLASPSPASGPRARVGASVFGSAPSPALSFICGSRHAHHLWRGATYGARALPATRPLAAAPRALRDSYDEPSPVVRPRPSPASTVSPDRDEVQLVVSGGAGCTGGA